MNDVVQAPAVDAVSARVSATAPCVAGCKVTVTAALGAATPLRVTLPAYVDVAGLGTGQYNLTVRADASREAGVIRIDPPTVQVRIASAKK